ncbi:MAG: FAD-binding protein [Planctomycetota bacterium]|jgi:succinate dehydrogenase/fumarate reductase flavoprotein subunit
MREEVLSVTNPAGERVSLPMTWVHTLVIGSGAAGLNAAVQLRANGVDDVLIVTEGLQMGTSINTGSDKQTYYKLSLCGEDADAPRVMADTYFSGGSMHGDLALVEASLSARAFINLVNLGVPFPRDAYGQFIGYKTDHDPRQRATSIGPFTSREMCRALIRQAQRLEIPVREDRNVVELIVVEGDGQRRAAGAVVVGADGSLEAYAAENVVFAVGGPGGLYKTSVYPQVHTGAIGLGLMAGATAQNLPESQYGMASIEYRWNVSGTYMQVIPRFISTAADGTSDEREFLREYFDSAGQLCSNVFLKGYQWPFDSRKVIGGSSIVDILVYIETVLKGRRVFLDFRRNPEDFRFEDLSDEASEYLKKSNALQDTPIERLRQMNPGAIDLYLEHDIDVSRQPLEIAVCAQHNNGGLAGNHWWESVNVKHLFPVGEVNGSHGAYRPGGSALNSGQVGSFRAAEFIANRYGDWSVSQEAVAAAAGRTAGQILRWLAICSKAGTTWQQQREEFQRRMSRAGAHIRSSNELNKAVAEAWEQVRGIEAAGCGFSDSSDSAEALRNRYLGFAHAVYLEAVRFALESGVGSRGSTIVLDSRGAKVHDKLDDPWRIAPEDPGFREKVLETLVGRDGKVTNRWVDRRPIPESDLWFETAWARFRSGEVYRV